MKKTAKRSLIFVLALLITGVMTCSDSFAERKCGSVCGAEQCICIAGRLGSSQPFIFSGIKFSASGLRHGGMSADLR